VGFGLYNDGKICVVGYNLSYLIESIIGRFILNVHMVSIRMCDGQLIDKFSK
jgi:hypothetical protein